MIPTLITVLMCIVAILFGLYIAWTVLVPFEKAWRAWKYDDRSGFSFLPVEVILLPLLILLSALSSGEAWYNHPLQVALWGIVAVVFMYGCFFVIWCVVFSLLGPFLNSKDGTVGHQTDK
jgi:hypothetical protein